MALMDLMSPEPEARSNSQIKACLKLSTSALKFLVLADCAIPLHGIPRRSPIHIYNGSPQAR